MLPYDEQRRTRTILPPNHGIRNQLGHLEAQLRVGRRSIWLEAVVIRICSRSRADLAHVGIRPRRDERLPIQLEREVGRRGVVEAEVHRRRLLVEMRERVVRHAVLREIAEPLRVVAILAEAGSYVELELRRKPEVDVRAVIRAARFPLIPPRQVHPETAGYGLAAVGIEPAPWEEPARLPEKRPAACTPVAIARGQPVHRSTEVDVPVVEQSHVTVEVQRVLKTRAGGIPRFPVISVHLRPTPCLVRIA